MKFRAGYEISYDCPQSTPMILTLSVHPSRFSDLLTPDRMRLDPPIPANTYHDSFGNFCHVIRAPAGRLTFPRTFWFRTRASWMRPPEGGAFILAALHLPRRGTPTRLLGQRYGLEARPQRRGPAR